MTKSLISVFLLLLSMNIIAQEEIITGRVFTSEGVAIDGASIRQKNAEYTYYSDYNGAFHLILEEDKEASISISKEGYFTLTVTGLDTISSMIKVVLYEMSRNSFVPSDDNIESFDLENDLRSEEMNIQALKIDSNIGIPEQIIGFTFTIYGEYMTKDFDEFKPDLGYYNTNYMNHSPLMIGYEIDLSVNKFYYGVSIGFIRSYDYHDSVRMQFNRAQYGLRFGFFNFLNTKRLFLSPNIWLRWDRYRLINSAKDYQIPINQYVSNRDLDIRFNQLTCFIGLNFAVKFYPNKNSLNYTSLGLYCGFNYLFNSVPWIYTKKNRLITYDEIILKNYLFGLTFSFHFE